AGGQLAFGVRSGRQDAAKSGPVAAVHRTADDAGAARIQDLSLRTVAAAAGFQPIKEDADHGEQEHRTANERSECLQLSELHSVWRNSRSSEQYRAELGLRADDQFVSRPGEHQRPRSAADRVCIEVQLLT